MTFEKERDGFRQFQEGFANIEQDFIRALQALHRRYDTAIRENRFVVGGATEIVLGAAMRACGVPVRHRGTQTVALDLLFENGEGGYSVKSMLRSSGTRLINVLGHQPSVEGWRAATLFLLPSGIAYADPELPWWQENKSAVIRVRTDALEIRRQDILRFAQAHPEWFIPCTLRVHTPKDERRFVRSASYDLALTVLKDLGGPLFRHLPELLED